MRWPVFLLIWLKLIFSESEVAGYKASGEVTAKGAKNLSSWHAGPSDTPNATGELRIQDELGAFVPTANFEKRSLAQLF